MSLRNAALNKHNLSQYKTRVYARMVLRYALRRVLQLVLPPKDARPPVFRVRLRLPEVAHELRGGDDLAQAAGVALDVGSVARQNGRRISGE